MGAGTRTGGTLWRVGIHVIHVWRVRETNAAQVYGTPPDWGVRPYGHRHRVREKGQEEASERVEWQGQMRVGNPRASAPPPQRSAGRKSR